MKFLTMALGGVLGIIVPLGFILACSLILDRPVTIMVVGIVFGFSATYALAEIVQAKQGSRTGDIEGRKDALAIIMAGASAGLILSGFYLYASDRPYYLLYKSIPHIAAAMIFVPGTLVGCGTILCLLAGKSLYRRPMAKKSEDSGHLTPS